MENINEKLNYLIGSENCKDVLEILKILVNRKSRQDNKFIASAIISSVALIKMCDENFINVINSDDVEKLMKVLDA